MQRSVHGLLAFFHGKDVDGLLKDLQDGKELDVALKKPGRFYAGLQLNGDGGSGIYFARKDDIKEWLGDAVAIKSVSAVEEL